MTEKQKPFVIYDDDPRFNKHGNLVLGYRTYCREGELRPLIDAGILTIKKRDTPRGLIREMVNKYDHLQQECISPGSYRDFERLHMDRMRALIEKEDGDE